MDLSPFHYNTFFFHFFAASILLFCPATSNMSATSRGEQRHSSLDQLVVIGTQWSAASKSCCLINPNVVNSKQGHRLDPTADLVP